MVEQSLQILAGWESLAFAQDLRLIFLQHLQIIIISELSTTSSIFLQFLAYLIFGQYPDDCNRLQQSRVISRQKMKNANKHTAKAQSSSDEVRQEIVDEIGKQLVTFKLVVVGESFTGKTSLIRRFLQSEFEGDYNVTVGADFTSKPVQVQDGADSVQLQIWDTCGHDMYRSMTSSFYRGACGALLIFGINNRKSFQQVKTWYRQFRQEGSPHAFIFLVGTKVDEEGDRKVSPQQAMEMMKEIKGAFYIETSARSGAQVQQVFEGVADIFYKTYQVSAQFRSLANPRKFHHSSILLSSHDAGQQLAGKKKKCC